MRADLLALSADDLAAFSNRGLARRAEQEAGSAQFTCEFAETPEGHVCFKWSDGVTCDLPAGARLSDSRCTCPSTTLCRHILRSVFAYKLQRGIRGPAPAARETLVPPADSATPPARTEPAASQGPRPAPVHPPGPARAADSAPAPTSAGAGQPWNPGEIPDSELTRFFSTAEFMRLQRELSSGHVVQLWTGAKPRAYLHTLGCTVNFLVPHDVRYAVCDCAAEAPCAHAALAVWAFRQLPGGQTSGLVSTAVDTPAVPLALIEEIEREVQSLAETSLSRAPSIQVDLWRRLAERAREAALIWPAEVLGEMAESQAAYLTGDARFDPREFLSCVAELLQRLDAVRNGRTPVPQLFVRGTVSNRETEFGSARLIGLGCGVRLYRGGTELTSYLQDSDSGGVVAVMRRFPDPPKEKGRAKAFCELASSIALKGANLAALGRGQLLIKGGRRTPSGQFIPGRAPVSVSPQAYRWETLRAPLRVSGFDELREQLKTSPPAALAPRQVGTRLTVCPVAAASEVEFLVSSQQIVAKLEDPLGKTAWLTQPYRSRSAGGTERLLAALRQDPASLRFVCGEARQAGADLLLSPISAVFEQAGTRTCIQPWIDPVDQNLTSTLKADEISSVASTDPLHDYIEELLNLLAETWLTGSRATRTEWQRLGTLGASLGFSTLADFSEPLAPRRVLELTVLADYAHREFMRLDTPAQSVAPQDRDTVRPSSSAS